MGMDLFVAGAASIDGVLALPGVSVVMVDNQLHMPGAALPAGWRDVRIRTPAGMLSLKRRDGGVAIVVFGNASPELAELQQRIGKMLEETR
jgi:hypothetical protein